MCVVVYDDQLCNFYIRDVRACSVASVMSNSLQPCGLKPTRLLCPWDSPGKNTGVSGLPFPSPEDLEDAYAQFSVIFCGFEIYV